MKEKEKVYILYGNNILVKKFKTKKEAIELQKELRQKEKEMFNCNNITFEIKEEEKIKLENK